MLALHAARVRDDPPSVCNFPRARPCIRMKKDLRGLFAASVERSFAASRRESGTFMGFLSKLLSFGEGKQLKTYEGIVDRINALEPEMQRRPMKSSPPSPSSSARAIAAASRRRPASRGVRRGARGERAHHRAASFRRPAHRRNRVASRADRRDEDRRGQDARLDPGRLPERHSRRQRAHRHGERLPRPARLRVDGAHLPFSRHEGRPYPERHEPRGEEARLRGRRHLRH